MIRSLARWRLRSLMIVVAIVALVGGVERIRRLSERYRTRAARFTQAERAYRSNLAAAREALRFTEARVNGRGITPLPQAPMAVWVKSGAGYVALPEEEQLALGALRDREAGQVLGLLRDHVARHSAAADYSARMRLKYERAAARPWIAVEPDPPTQF